ncbi:alcohol dehydrogenase catalytic domain-containing protein [Oceanispirochaeta sp.]|jgi:L-iditol 2-dehydrogenase|uniref:zinc-dependent alcohol dehydrogenase n=1 Tax=Oceanispirochaeta sp. TaxID=2035350 RepID=UPI002630D857|nr:alcohol dehydrogenase catalytic domain-containing protein [Oceanispirochaeta sp.]MDA3959061.1 alcohol dehydrogenase catalytic domain-containing protein [Oceanispirochaeta sp.]
MRQAVMTSPGTIEFKEVSQPEAGPGEVLVKVMSIGVCGSDVHVYHGLHPYTSYPVVQGHEVSCEVVRPGEGGSGFAPGDKVTIEPQVSCGKCFSCRSGLYNICDELKVLGFQTTGCASDYFVAPAAKLVKLDPTMKHDHGALMEPLSVAVRAVNQAFSAAEGGIKGKQVLVYGAGPIGNLVAQAAKGMGASKVMISDLNDFRLEKAKACGVERTNNPSRENLVEQVDEFFGKDRKADVIFECVGVGSTMDSAIDIARKGTPIVVVGVFGKKAEIDMARVNENELKLLGTARYVLEDFEIAKDLVASAKVHLDPLVTDVFEFEKYKDAYLKIQNEAATTMKVVVRVNP